MDDELLRSLWQPSEEDSFFDYWDPEKKKARKEVMKHLGEMVTSAPCPREGENTSNLYRMLVKKLREQISNFDSNPEVVDVATKKLAKWVENLVKEAYYRKQGRITSPLKKPPVQEDIVEEVQEARIDKTNLQVIHPEKDLPKSKHLKDLQENLLKKALRDSEMLDDAYVTDVKIRKRPNVIYKQKDYIFPVPEEHPRQNENAATGSSDVESSPKSNINKIPKESNLITQTKNLTVQDDHVVVMKPDKTHVYIVDQEVQVSKGFLNNRGNKENRRSDSEDEPSVSTVSENNSSVDDESKSSSARLVKNWSSWMVNLTKKAKSLVQWDVDLVDQVESSEINELTSSEVAMQEKWNKLLAVNESLKLKKALEREATKAKTSDQKSTSSSNRSTSKNRSNRSDKDNEKDKKHN